MRFALFIVAWCALTALPARAGESLGATSIEVKRTGEAAESCPDEATFVAAVARMMHRELAAGPSMVTVAMHAEPERVDGSVTMKEARGAVVMERRLHGKRCRDVGEGLALIVALAIDPLADPSLPTLPEPERLVVPPPPPWLVAAPVKQPSAPSPAPQVEEPRAFHFAPVVGARLTWGLEPVSTEEVVLGVEGGWRRGRWTPSLRLDGGPLATTSIAAGDGSVVFSGAEIEAVACPAAFTVGSTFTLVAAACFSGGAMIVSTRSIGYAIEHSTSSAIWFLGPTLLARVGVAGPLGVVIEAGLRLPLASFEWDVQGYGAIGQTAAIAGTTAIALDLRVP